jgi:hypothetical protein
VRWHGRDTTAAYHGHGLSAADLHRRDGPEWRGGGTLDPDPPRHRAGSEKHPTGRLSYDPFMAVTVSARIIPAHDPDAVALGGARSLINFDTSELTAEYYERKRDL